MDFESGEILYFNKPYTWTSFRLVGRIRWIISKAFGIKKLKVGHAGALDPLATGVMIICTGKATKKIESFQYQTKEYIATLQLGATTPSFDMEHEVDQTFPYEHITKEMINEVLPQFTGEIMQTPPLFSAVKIDGKRAYKYERNGETVNLKSKPLVIDEIEVLNFDLPKLELRIVCSKGTYIRALARDIGTALNSGAYLTALKRTKIGNVTLNDCLNIEDFEEKYKTQNSQEQDNS